MKSSLIMTRLRLVSSLFAVVATVAMGLAPTVAAQSPASADFSLNVTPSPIVTTLKPGATADLELKIRNAGAGPEDLKIEPRSFKVDDETGQVLLDDTKAPDFSSWITFSAPTFKVKPGEWFTQKIHVALPKDTGFSYSLALIISRASNPDPTTTGGRLIKGSLAVFTLINVDRPGAKREIEIADFKPTHPWYEFLPAMFNIKVKNTGNMIVQPYGNIFIQRDGKDQTPIATLPLNEQRGYVLAGTSRQLNISWTDGFPHDKQTVGPDGRTTSETVWDWSKVSDLRYGKYTAKLVAVYNDGHRDVPIEREVTFWVIPWKLLLGALVVTIILGFGIWSIIRSIMRAVNPRRGSMRM